MKSQTPDLDNILKFLRTKALNDRPHPLNSIVEFLNTERVQAVFEEVLESIAADECPDYFTYFNSLDGINELVKLKDTDRELYYKVINCGTALINVLTRMLEMPFVIVITPEDLTKTYYIKLSAKNE